MRNVGPHCHLVANTSQIQLQQGGTRQKVESKVPWCSEHGQLSCWDQGGEMDPIPKTMLALKLLLWVRTSVEEQTDRAAQMGTGLTQPLPPFGCGSGTPTRICTQRFVCCFKTLNSF